MATGEEVVVRLHYHASEPIEEPVFGIALHTLDGQHVTGPNTRDGELSVGRLSGDGHVDLRVPRLMLTPGTYELTVAAYDHSLVHAFDHREKVLRFDVTPVGLHYLLTHYDIPEVDPGSWSLEVDGLVERALSLSLGDLHGRPSVETAVTLECAGNGRALLEPHVESQPWLLEAVGTPVAVGPHRPLARIARQRGWSIVGHDG